MKFSSIFLAILLSRTVLGAVSPEEQAMFERQYFEASVILPAALPDSDLLAKNRCAKTAVLRGEFGGYAAQFIAMTNVSELALIDPSTSNQLIASEMIRKTFPNMRTKLSASPDLTSIKEGTFDCIVVPFVANHIAKPALDSLMKDIFERLHDKGHLILLASDYSRQGFGIKRTHENEWEVTPLAAKFLGKMLELAKQNGGDPAVGNQETIIPILKQAGFQSSKISHRFVLVGGEEEPLRSRVSKKVIQYARSVAKPVLKSQIISNEQFEGELRAIEQAAGVRDAFVIVIGEK